MNNWPHLGGTANGSHIFTKTTLPIDLGDGKKIRKSGREFLMSVLAVPENSQLLLVNPVPRCLLQLDRDFAGQISEEFARLSAAANQALVPRYFAMSQPDDEREAWLSTPCEKRKPRVFRFERDRPVWSNEELLVAMQREDREQLFICGFWLDDVVAAAALEAQPLGFNTHVIVDLSLDYNRQRRRASLDRLNQYGIAPISLQNLLYEWMAKTDDDDRRGELETLWQEQKHFDRRDASAARTGLS